MLWFEFAILIACVVVGARLGGVGLGAVSGLGLLIFVFILGMPPGNPPTTVLGMIIAVITALSAMQAAGGLDYLLEVAESVLHRNPRRVTLLAPFVAYALIFISGTQHVIYALLPIIAEVSMDQTGTTRIGKHLLNHSFMLPGLVSTVASTATALALSSLLIQ